MSRQSHHGIQWLSHAMAFGDHLSQWRSVNYLLCYEMFLDLFRTASVDINALSRYWSNSFDVSSSLLCSCSRTDHTPSQCTYRYTWYPPCARCTYYLQLLGTLAAYRPGMFSAPSPGVLAVTCLDIHIIVFWIHLSFHLQLHWLTLLYLRLLTNLQPQFSAGKCAPRCFLPALPVQSSPVCTL